MMRVAREAMWLGLIAVLAMSKGMGDYQGPLRLAASIQDARAELLVYSNNGNDVGLLTKNSVQPLALDTRLSTPGGCCLHPATPSLSPDGRRVAYVHLVTGQLRREEINIYDRDNQKQKEVFEAGLIWGIAWAPDGNRLAIIADKAGEQSHDLFLVDLTTNTVNQLTHELVPLGDERYSVSNHVPPSWSGDGRRMVVELRASGMPAEDSPSGVVAVWDVETGEVRKLADGVAPAWSPAQDVIAFFEPSRQRCFTVKPDGSEKKLLFALGARGFGSKLSLLSFPVVWSPDGRHLIFHQWVDADLVIDVYRLDLTNGKPKFLTRSEVQVVNWREMK